MVKLSTRITVLLTCPVAIMIYLLVVHPLWTAEFKTPSSRLASTTPRSTPASTTPPRSLIPSKDVLLQMPKTDLEELYHRYAENIEVVCINKVRMGLAADGGWDVCDDPQYRPRPPCVGYSFGNRIFPMDCHLGVVGRLECLNNPESYAGWNFMLLVAPGCTLRCPLGGEITPECKKKNVGCKCQLRGRKRIMLVPQASTRCVHFCMNVPSHRRSDLVFFHAVGLDDHDHASSDAWPLKTLASIMVELNHTEIDILKMDIELYEFQALPDIIQSGVLKKVRQLLFEIHVSINGDNSEKYELMVKGLEIFRGLHELGFRIFYTHRNPYCAHLSRFSGRSLIGCHEVFMVNVNRAASLVHTQSDNSTKSHRQQGPAAAVAER